VIVGSGVILVKELPVMPPLSRRDFLDLALTVPAGLASANGIAAEPEMKPADIHQQILELAALQEQERRARFAAVKNKGDLDALASSLRQTFLKLIGDLPGRQGVPPVQKTGTIEADDYIIEKLVFESFPGYFVSGLLYKPKRITAPVPGVLSPCGHTVTGKSGGTYQILHINLAKRGYVVLTYDPIGQGERSQFWDAAKGRSRFNLSCGEHAVLGNPLYLLGTNLARYRIFDGLRGLDYLTSLPEVDASKIGCVGNSGGGTLTAYIAALDARVSAVAIGCYITTLRRRMGNRIQQDPDADPEQDIFSFVSAGIDHAGLLAMIAPRPTLLGFAQFDFFPIEGARETFAEAKRLYEVAGAGDRIDRVEAAERHGLSPPLRMSTYEWFGRWLSRGRAVAPATEMPVTPRSAQELTVCKDGQVSLSFRSRPLLPLALEQFDDEKKPDRIPLRQLLNLDNDRADPQFTWVSPAPSQVATTILCINGNESRNWRDETSFFDGLAQPGLAVAVVDPRGVAQRRPKFEILGRGYVDPLVGVEENIAYNAFLVGKSLLGMRVTDVVFAVRKMLDQAKPKRVVLCARADAALIACFAAALEPAIELVATEGMILSFRSLFSANAAPINAASILPDLVRRYGDIAEVVGEIAPRRVLVAAGVGTALSGARNVSAVPDRFSQNPRILTDWIRDRG
jgi:hypothetical protein